MACRCSQVSAPCGLLLLGRRGEPPHSWRRQRRLPVNLHLGSEGAESMSEVTRRIWSEAGERMPDAERWEQLPGAILRGFVEAIEADPDNLELRSEAACSMEFLRLMLRNYAVALLREAVEKHPEHADARTLLEAYES